MIKTNSGDSRERAGRLCQCQFCLVEGICTPCCDFYSNGEKGSPLACESCMRQGRVMDRVN